MTVISDVHNISYLAERIVKCRHNECKKPTATNWLCRRVRSTWHHVKETQYVTFMATSSLLWRVNPSCPARGTRTSPLRGDTTEQTVPGGVETLTSCVNQKYWLGNRRSTRRNKPFCYMGRTAARHSLKTAAGKTNLHSHRFPAKSTELQPTLIWPHTRNTKTCFLM